MRMIKWSMIILCMVGYGELRVMSVYAAIAGILVAVSMMIYAAIDIYCSTPTERRARRREKHNNER